MRTFGATALVGVVLLLCAEAVRWPGCVIPYKTAWVTQPFNEGQLKSLEEAFKMWETKVPGLLIRPYHPNDTRHMLFLSNQFDAVVQSENPVVHAQGTCGARCLAGSIGLVLGVHHPLKREDAEHYVKLPDSIKNSFLSRGWDLGPFDYSSVTTDEMEISLVTSPVPFVAEGVSDNDAAVVLFLNNYCKPPVTTPRCLASVDRRTPVGIGVVYQLTFVGTSEGNMKATVNGSAEGEGPLGGMVVSEATEDSLHMVRVGYTAQEAARGKNVQFTATFTSTANPEETAKCTATLAVDASGVVCWGRGGSDPSVCGGRGQCASDGCVCDQQYEGISCAVERGREFGWCAVNQASDFEGPMPEEWSGSKLEVSSGVLL
eukprot:Sspe_Gene.119554::Locus_115800_Transcript_1_1_Confidence_1.000_Length_1181::g.119554::m.119554